MILGVDYAPDVVGIAPYTTGLAEHLASAGMEVRVVTTFAHYPRYEWSGPAPLRGLVEERNGVTVDRRWVILPRTDTVAWRILFDMSFGVVALAAVMLARCDVVISVCVPIQAGFVGGLVGRIRRLPSILLVQDLPVAAATSTGLLRSNGTAARIGRLVESLAMRLNQRVIVINERFAGYARQSGVAPGSLQVVPNWVNDRVPHSAHGRSMFGLKDDLFLIVYAGNIGHKQGLDVLPALSKLMSPNSQLLVIGDGSQKDRLEEACRQVGASNITFTGLQSPESLASALASANVLFLSQSARVVDSVVPSKLLTYMAAGKPVLAAVDANSVAAEIVKKAGCGIVVMPGSARDIADGFADLAARPLEELGMLGENARQYVADHHNRGSILARWVSLIGELAELQRGGRSH